MSHNQMTPDPRGWDTFAAMHGHPGRYRRVGVDAQPLRKAAAALGYGYCDPVVLRDGAAPSLFIVLKYLLENGHISEAAKQLAANTLAESSQLGELDYETQLPLNFSVTKQIAPRPGMVADAVCKIDFLTLLAVYDDLATRKNEDVVEALKSTKTLYELAQQTEKLFKGLLQAAIDANMLDSLDVQKAQLATANDEVELANNQDQQDTAATKELFTAPEAQQTDGPKPDVLTPDQRPTA